MSDADQISALFKGVLTRSPTPAELDLWTGQLTLHKDLFKVFSQLVGCDEYKNLHRVPTAWAPGHFYSPVVDPETVRDYVNKSRTLTRSDIAGIDLDISAMEQFWRNERAFIAATPFTMEPNERLRYYWRDSPYPVGDATTYRAVINFARPKRIVEIGSGFSSACALDTIDEVGIKLSEFTCIEPYPAALLRRISAADRDRLNIIESIVQNVPVSTFEVLERNDILFIDSTHVLKTGSDVHYEFFSILPMLKPGVLVHFHDIRWPFEYPSQFIFDRNFSWNEAYGLRAFLMYNNRFSVFFYNSLFATEHGPLARQTFPDFMINPGSSIWLRVNDS